MPFGGCGCAEVDDFKGNWDIQEQADGTLKNVGGLRQAEASHSQVTQADGSPISSEDAAKGRFARRILPNGTQITQEHDADGFVNKRSYSDGSSVSTQRNSFSQVTRHVDRQGRVTKYSYDSRGNLTQTEVGIQEINGQDIQQPEYASKTNTYYPTGHQNQYLLATSTDFNGNTTDYTYDANNQLISITQPADEAAGTRPVSTFTYDSARRLSSSTDPLGRTTSYSYDNRDRIVSVTYNDNSTEETLYGTGTQANLVVAQKDRNNNWTAYQYDSSSRRIQTVSGLSTAEKDSYLAGTLTLNASQHSIETCTYYPGTTLRKDCQRNGSLTKYFYDYRNRLIKTQTHPTVGKVLETTQTYLNNLLFKTTDPTVAAPTTSTATPTKPK